MNTNPTQAQQILNHLKTGKVLTAVQAAFHFGCHRLSARVYELNKDLRGTGTMISKREVVLSGTPPRHYAEYFFEVVDE